MDFMDHHSTQYALHSGGNWIDYRYPPTGTLRLFLDSIPDQCVSFLTPPADSGFEQWTKYLRCFGSVLGITLKQPLVVVYRLIFAHYWNRALNEASGMGFLFCSVCVYVFSDWFQKRKLQNTGWIGSVFHKNYGKTVIILGQQDSTRMFPKIVVPPNHPF